jgi:hypothetical protein
MKCPFRSKTAVLIIPYSLGDFRTGDIHDMAEQVAQTLNVVPDCIEEDCALWKTSRELCSLRRDV